jgi:hypothetical protein
VPLTGLRRVQKLELRITPQEAGRGA